MSYAGKLPRRRQALKHLQNEPIKEVEPTSADSSQRRRAKHINGGHSVLQKLLTTLSCTERNLSHLQFMRSEYSLS